LGRRGVRGQREGSGSVWGGVSRYAISNHYYLLDARCLCTCFSGRAVCGSCRCGFPKSPVTSHKSRTPLCVYPLQVRPSGHVCAGHRGGVSVDTALNMAPSNVASREVIDRQNPNPDVCLANGYSAMVLDSRLFISFDPVSRLRLLYCIVLYCTVQYNVQYSTSQYSTIPFCAVP